MRALQWVKVLSRRIRRGTVRCGATRRRFHTVPCRAAPCGAVPDPVWKDDNRWLTRVAARQYNICSVGLVTRCANVRFSHARLVKQSAISQNGWNFCSFIIMVSLRPIRVYCIRLVSQTFQRHVTVVTIIVSDRFAVSGWLVSPTDRVWNDWSHTDIHCTRTAIVQLVCVPRWRVEKLTNNNRDATTTVSSYTVLTTTTGWRLHQWRTDGHWQPQSIHGRPTQCVTVPTYRIVTVCQHHFNNVGLRQFSAAALYTKLDVNSNKQATVVGLWLTILVHVHRRELLSTWT